MLIGILFSMGTAYATHNRAGEITYEQLSNLKYRVTITTYTKESSAQADRDSLSLDWGDGTSTVIPRSNGPIGGGGNHKGESLGNDIKLNLYVETHTYPGPGKYIISMEDPNRNEGICNIPNSVNTTFYLESELNILDPQFFGFNNSPKLLQPPIDFGNQHEVFIHNPNAFDVDGDSLAYELVECMGENGIPLPGYDYPDQIDPGPDNNLTLDEMTGELVWDAPPKCCEFNICILIKEYRNGFLIGKVLRDMQITILCENNNPPVIRNINDTCVWAGDTLDFTVVATDVDAGQTVTLTAEGGPFELTNSPATFDEESGLNAVSSDFTWITNCEHIQKAAYTIVFKAEDDYAPGGVPKPLADLETWLVDVVAPPPENLTATAQGNDITLNWQDPYRCYDASDFMGFSVWRREGSNPFIPDSCEIGLKGRGYTKIADGLLDFTYVDTSLQRGRTYCYRILAHFGEVTSEGFPFNTTESVPSHEACAQLKRDVPIITNVSVERTDTENGLIYVAWSNPLPDVDNLDTLQNPGPYMYKLYRSEGFTGSNFTEIATFTANAFAHLNDTTFLDSLIDTKSGPFSYKVEFFVEGDELVGETTVASSVFLSIGATDNQLDLTWEEHVPWLNYEYVVYRFDSTIMLFDSIATVTEPAYSDKGLKNGRQYCYIVESFGSYSSPGLIDPIRNKSQINCGIPIDTIPPCPPQLTVTNQCGLFEDTNEKVYCDDLKIENYLTWTNPNTSCEGDDAVKYRIYYAPTIFDTYTLIDSILSPDDTTFTHDKTSENTLSGCYKVTAVDSFNNESAAPSGTCIDNCPCYKLPNVFTPNLDAQNDFFIPYPYRFVDHIDIKIYNRWGSLVWEESDPDINWDGTDQKTGKPLAAGVYYYVCEVYVQTLNGIQPIPEPLNGFVHLIISGD